MKDASSVDEEINREASCQHVSGWQPNVLVSDNDKIEYPRQRIWR